MDSQTPGPFGVKRARLEHLVSLGQRYADAETFFHQTKVELWSEISAIVADLQADLPELFTLVDQFLAEALANGFGTAAGDDCGHDHAAAEPTPPETAADAVELGARQVADELDQARAEPAADAIDTPSTNREPDQRLPAIGTPQDRVRAALYKAHLVDGVQNDDGGARELSWLQSQTGLNPVTLLKAVTAQVKAGKVEKLGDAYRFVC